MGLTMPSFMMPLVALLFSSLPGLIAQAEAAFSGQPNSGPLKKKFVMDAATTLLQSILTVNGTLLTKEQSDHILVCIDKLVDAGVECFNTAKLFQPPAASV